MRLKAIAAVGLAFALAGPAFAQTETGGNAPARVKQPGAPSVLTPGQPPTAVIEGGSPAVANSGPGSAGTLARSGTGADNVTNNPGNSSNASNPSRAVPNTGGGGGGSGQ